MKNLALNDETLNYFWLEMISSLDRVSISLSRGVV